MPHEVIDRLTQLARQTLGWFSLTAMSTHTMKAGRLMMVMTKHTSQMTTMMMKMITIASPSLTTEVRSSGPNASDVDS